MSTEDCRVDSQWGTVLWSQISNPHKKKPIPNPHQNLYTLRALLESLLGPARGIRSILPHWSPAPRVIGLEASHPAPGPAARRSTHPTSDTSPRRSVQLAIHIWLFITKTAVVFGFDFGRTLTEEGSGWRFFKWWWWRGYRSPPLPNTPQPSTYRLPPPYTYAYARTYSLPFSSARPSSPSPSPSPSPHPSPPASTPLPTPANPASESDSALRAPRAHTRARARPGRGCGEGPREERVCEDLLGVEDVAEVVLRGVCVAMWGVWAGHVAERGGCGCGRYGDEGGRGGAESGSESQDAEEDEEEELATEEEEQGVSEGGGRGRRVRALRRRRRRTPKRKRAPRSVNLGAPRGVPHRVPHRGRARVYKVCRLLQTGGVSMSSWGDMDTVLRQALRRREMKEHRYRVQAAGSGGARTWTYGRHSDMLAAYKNYFISAAER
ncbi:hypothetical protein JB92DRAFT_2837795 [Gautieria morchelliformis]|nr:hypothetical protein JB92DRAFT_2837795 [Gautieria morchelliformis]